MFKILDPTKITWEWTTRESEYTRQHREERGWPSTYKTLTASSSGEDRIIMFFERGAGGVYQPSMTYTNPSIKLQERYTEGELEQAKTTALLIYDAYLWREYRKINAVKRDDL